MSGEILARFSKINADLNTKLESAQQARDEDAVHKALYDITEVVRVGAAYSAVLGLVDLILEKYPEVEGKKDEDPQGTRKWSGFKEHPLNRQGGKIIINPEVLIGHRQYELLITCCSLQPGEGFLYKDRTSIITSAYADLLKGKSGEAFKQTFNSNRTNSITTIGALRYNLSRINEEAAITAFPEMKDTLAYMRSIPGNEGAPYQKLLEQLFIRALDFFGVAATGGPISISKDTTLVREPEQKELTPLAQGSIEETKADSLGERPLDLSDVVAEGSPEEESVLIPPALEFALSLPESVSEARDLGVLVGANGGVASGERLGNAQGGRLYDSRFRFPSIQKAFPERGEVTRFELTKEELTLLIKGYSRVDAIEFTRHKANSNPAWSTRQKLAEIVKRDLSDRSFQDALSKGREQYLASLRMKLLGGFMEEVSVDRFGSEDRLVVDMLRNIFAVENPMLFEGLVKAILGFVKRMPPGPVEFKSWEKDPPTAQPLRR